MQLLGDLTAGQGSRVAQGGGKGLMTGGPKVVSIQKGRLGRLDPSRCLFVCVWVLRLNTTPPTSHNDGRVLVCILDAWPELSHMLEIYNANVSHVSVNLIATACCP